MKPNIELNNPEDLSLVIIPHIKPKRIPIREEIDVEYATLETKSFSRDLGFSVSLQFLLSTVVSELARNIFSYATHGKITLNAISNKKTIGIEIIAEDEGPGITDIEKALKDNFSTGGTLGLGLPASKRMMDDFTIDPHYANGTRIQATKWKQ